MKRISTVLALMGLLLLGSTLGVHAQADSIAATPIDSTMLPVQVTLDTNQHGFILYLVKDQPQDPAAVQYVFQVVETLYESHPATITVTVRAGLVLRLYRQMGELPEFLSSNVNAEIKPKLLEQLMNQLGTSNAPGAGWLLRQLSAKARDNVIAQQTAAESGLKWAREAKQ